MASDKVVRAAAISYGLKEQLHSTVLWKSVRVCCVVRTEHEWWGKYAGWEAHHREGKWKETGLWDKSLNSERMLGGPTWPTEMGGGGGLSRQPGTQMVCLILLAVSYPFCWCWERGTPTATWGTKEGTGPTARPCFIQVPNLTLCPLDVRTYAAGAWGAEHPLWDFLSKPQEHKWPKEG